MAIGTASFVLVKRLPPRLLKFTFPINVRAAVEQTPDSLRRTAKPLVFDLAVNQLPDAFLAQQLQVFGGYIQLNRCHVALVQFATSLKNLIRINRNSSSVYSSPMALRATAMLSVSAPMK